jgi:hypothetical protein
LAPPGRINATNPFCFCGQAIAISQQVADLEALLTAVPGNASQLPGHPKQQPLASFKVRQERWNCSVLTCFAVQSSALV